MIKRNNDGQKSRRKKITPIIFLPSSSRGISHSATSLPFLPTLRRCYPAGCSYTMPNGRPGTLIEISFLIEGTYLVVKTWKGRGEKRKKRWTTRTSTSTFLLRSFSFNRSICFLFKPPSPFYARYLSWIVIIVVSLWPLIARYIRVIIKLLTSMNIVRDIS